MTYNFKIIEDKKKWNKFVENFASTNRGVQKSTFIQSYNWIEFQKNLKNKSYSIAIFNEENIVGVIAAVQIEAKRGKYLYIRNGPLLDFSNKELVDQTVKFLKNFAKKNKLWFIRISPLIEKNSHEENILQQYNFPDCPMHDVEALDTWLMEIGSKSEQELLTDQKKKTRYEIKKAKKLGCEVLVTQDEKYIEDYYNILKDTVKRQGWNSYSKQYILEEFRTFAKDNLASIVLIKYKDIFIAGGIFIHFGEQSFYHYGASLTEYKHIPGAYLMIWEAILEARRREKKYFNFWGISPEKKDKHPWDGLTSFKKKFNGFEQRWSHSKDIPVSPLYYLTNVYERIDKYRKGY